jgi:xanthine dehydrogenase molybdenum-binding subunit
MNTSGGTAKVRVPGYRFLPAIDNGAAKFGWKEKWKGWGRPTSVDGNKRRGVGVGIHSNADVGEDDSEAWVKLTPDGRALVCVAIAESGQGQRSSLCKMVAEILQLPLDHVNMSFPDTDGNPHEFAPGGFTGHVYFIGSAVIQAAEDARRQLLEHGARAMRLTPEELDTVDGWVFEIKNPDHRLPRRKATGLTTTIRARAGLTRISRCAIFFASSLRLKLILRQALLSS